LACFPPFGRPVVAGPNGPHDGRVTSTPLPEQPDPTGAAPVVVASSPARVHALEQFWRSRRGHAFDELCR